MTARIRRRPIRWLVLVVSAGVLVATTILLVRGAPQPRRSTPVFDPPVLAGQPLWGPCSGGFYARHRNTVVLTSTGHCTAEGTVAHDPDGVGVRGVFGPAARDATCPHPNHSCASSDINFLVVAADRIPWGRLNLVDLGVGGYREVSAGARPLACADIAIGDLVEINGRDIFRTGHVNRKGENLNDGDGAYFPCMVIADAQVASGDSGGAVLVRGTPAGVISRSFGGSLGFTPLADGLTQLGLELCTMPNCDLERLR
jgi:hypothetical protein